MDTPKASMANSPINPPEASGPRNGDLPAYVSNGLVGLRVREQPLQAGMAIVSGFSGEHPERRVEAAAPAPYPLAGDIGLTRSGLRTSHHRCPTSSRPMISSPAN